MITFSQLGDLGRMGNAIFQAACTISTALDNDVDYMFPDTWKYKDSFNLYNCFSSNIKPTKVYQEPHFHYSKIPYQGGNLDLRGYFQAPKYFENNQDVILPMLTPKIGYGIKYNTTAIHCRRTDYINLSEHHTNLTMDYYKEAMNIIKSKNYMVFSDDIDWCKKNFIGEQFYFVDLDEVNSLALMLACEHQIIANSSFSFFGAYLNRNPSKTVIAPKNWFGPKLNHDTKDLLPKEWIKI